MALRLNFKKVLDQAPKARSSHRILVVDDEEGNLRTMERYLGELYHVKCLNSPLEALEHLNAPNETANYSVVISDHIMPDMTGIQFLTKLAEQDHKAIRIILTGYAALNNVIEAINDAKVFRFVTKPVDGAHLRSIVAEAVQLYDLDRQREQLSTQLDELSADRERLHAELSLQRNSQAKRSTKEVAPTSIALTLLEISVHGIPLVSEDISANQIFDLLSALYRPIEERVVSAGGQLRQHRMHECSALFGIRKKLHSEDAIRLCTEACEILARTIQTLPAPFNQLHASLAMSHGSVAVGQRGASQATYIVGNAAAVAQDLRKLATQALRSGDRSLLPLDSNDRAVALISHELADAGQHLERIALPSTWRHAPNLHAGDPALIRR